MWCSVQQCVYSMWINSLIRMCVCLISNLSCEWRSRTNPKLPSNPLLTRYEPPLFPPDPSSLALSPLSLHLSFPRSDKVILQRSEIRWVSSSTDRWRWGQAQVSRRWKHTAEQTAIRRKVDTSSLCILGNIRGHAGWLMCFCICVRVPQIVRKRVCYSVMTDVCSVLWISSLETIWASRSLLCVFLLIPQW